jgi:hypothetical protein
VVHLSLIGHVDLDESTINLGGCFFASYRIHVTDYDLGTLSREAACGCQSNTGGTARDYGYFAR